ncbi:MAG: hypothetical protein WCL39_11380, partial [Armatimonadota bacterium]
LLVTIMQAELLLASMSGSANKWRDARGHLSRLEELGAGGDVIDAMVARAAYELGDIATARSRTDAMLAANPSSVRALFNKAFFAITDREYAAAIAYYERIHGLPRVNEVYREIIRFFSTRLDSRPAEPTYRFARGVVQFWFMDRKAGLADLKEFLRRANDPHVYECLRNRANELLNQAERSKQPRHKPRRNKRR